MLEQMYGLCVIRILNIYLNICNRMMCSVKSVSSTHGYHFMQGTKIARRDEILRDAKECVHMIDISASIRNEFSLYCYDTY